MAWSLLGYSAPGTYGAATNKPAGATGPGYIIIDCAHFYDSTSTATISGFTAERAAIGGNGVVATKLYKYYADLSSAPSSFSVTISGGGGDPILACSAYSGLDSSSPVPSGGVQTATASGGTTLSVSGGTVTVDGALAHISCSSWDFSEWSSSSPTGYTRDSGSSTSECGTYHTTSPQAVGTSIGASFSGTSGTNEEACVLVVFQLPASTASSWFAPSTPLQRAEGPRELERLQAPLPALKRPWCPPAPSPKALTTQPYLTPQVVLPEPLAVTSAPWVQQLQPASVSGPTARQAPQQPQPALISSSWVHQLPPALSGSAPSRLELATPQPALVSGSWVQPLPPALSGSAPSRLELATPQPALISGSWVQPLPVAPAVAPPAPPAIVTTFPTIEAAQLTAWVDALPLPLVGASPKAPDLFTTFPTIEEAQLTAWGDYRSPEPARETPQAPRVTAVLPGIGTAWVQTPITTRSPSRAAPFEVILPIAPTAPAWVQSLDYQETFEKPSSVRLAQALPDLIPFQVEAWVPSVTAPRASDEHTPPAIVEVLPDLIPYVPPEPPNPPRPRRHTVVGTPGGGFPTKTIYTEDGEPDFNQDFYSREEYRKLFDRFSGLIDSVEERIETKEAEVQQTSNNSRLWAMMTLGLVCGKIGGLKGVFFGLGIATIVTARSPAAPKQLPGKTPKKLR